MDNYPKIPLVLNSSDNNFTLELYDPCFKWANKYDRGVGYFTSGWIAKNAYGLSHFASNGGSARWITSPILEEKDLLSLSRGLIEPKDIDLESILKKDVKQLQKYLEEETLNSIAWLIYDEILEFKFAIPTKKLNGGDFHDKFGIFYGEHETLSFNGSVNDSIKGESNYESIKVFPTWRGLNEFVENDIKRFEKIWNNKDENLIVYDLPNAIKNDVFKLRTSKRPYKLPKERSVKNQWRHQDDAIREFLNVGNGVLEMATGTGKTRTALSIANILKNNKSIKSAIITVEGTDLLDQWAKEIGLRTKFKIFKQFGKHKEVAEFLLNPDESFLIISRDYLVNNIDFIINKVAKESIIICDEVHGFGSKNLVENLSGKIHVFKYRLGLSATPERAFDEIGNKFIKEEIGVKLFEFSLVDAIKRGILCEFDYSFLEFELTDDDKKMIRKTIAAFKAKQKAGEFVSVESLYRDLAMVKKISKAKLPIFHSFLKSNSHILKRSIIFVETKTFGKAVQDIIIRFESNYHTYYGEDDRDNLLRFSNGELNCLITSKRISEGIDISSVNNIILFSADKAKVQTIQRIGRSLRLDLNNPNKRAFVLDFVQFDDDENIDKENTDQERSKWLSEIAKTRIGET
ncbi:DEAD/DEAH box helicase [Exiguobacterium sp. SH0S7]|uniref:DEAD/DEAH box helicase family protein n=1 Tax=Exiguobacterium sp. SH0S7 TaxID=2510951 RepID=UPI0010405582|nr:DEAD/DEAH box helicase family protein [Exiguobacterium sp. SH0S7]TCI72205.1 DEAD/DEAH box helicase [Exiguobacterium sp. SH0S7]